MAGREGRDPAPRRSPRVQAQADPPCHQPARVGTAQRVMEDARRSSQPVDRHRRVPADRADRRARAARRDLPRRQLRGAGRGVVQAPVPRPVARRAAGRAGHPHAAHRPRADRPGAVRRPGHARPRDRQPGHVSKGRGAWNIITSQHEHGRKILGAGSELARSAKYDKADEYVTIVTQLWESLPPDAIVADAARTTYVDAGRLRPVEFQGDYYQASGVLGVVGGYQGRRPVLLQAGASESSKQFGSKWADALFTSHWMKPSAQEFYTGRQAVRGAGSGSRDPEKLLVVPGVYPVPRRDRGAGQAAQGGPRRPARP